MKSAARLHFVCELVPSMKSVVAENKSENITPQFVKIKKPHDPVGLKYW